MLALREVEGAKTVKARVVAKGYPGPDVRNGGVGRRSPHLELISLGAWRKWAIWSLGIRNACLQAGGFGREVYVRASCE